MPPSLETFARSEGQRKNPLTGTDIQNLCLVWSPVPNNPLSTKLKLYYSIQPTEAGPVPIRIFTEPAMRYCDDLASTWLTRIHLQAPFADVPGCWTNVHFCSGFQFQRFDGTGTKTNVLDQWGVHINHSVGEHQAFGQLPRPTAT